MAEITAPTPSAQRPDAGIALKLPLLEEAGVGCLATGAKARSALCLLRLRAAVVLAVSVGLANHERMWLDLDDEIGAFSVVVEAGALAFEFLEASHRGSP
jgi:hypothetical protein